MTEAEIVFVGENEVEGGRTGVQAGAAAAAVRPAEVALVIGRGRAVCFREVAKAPADAAVTVMDAPRDATGAENRKRSNELMRNEQFYGEGIRDEDIDEVQSRQRQRIEKSSEVETVQHVSRGQKRGRLETGGGIESGEEQGARAAVIRARVHAGADGVQGVRTVRLAAVTTELQCMGEYVAVDGLGRHKQVRWVSGRWSVEEVYMGQGEGRDGNGGGQGGEHSVIVSWESADEATIDSEEDELRRRGAWELEAAAVESTAARRGYTTSAAWDEGAMIQAMARMDNPTLRWRYGVGT